MKINQEINLELEPCQIARYIYECWCGDDLIKFLNCIGLYLTDVEDIFNAAKDDLDKLDNHGREVLDIIKKHIN